MSSNSNNRIYYIWAIFGYRPSAQNPEDVQMQFNPNYFEGFTNGTYQSAKDISDDHKQYYDNLEKN